MRRRIAVGLICLMLASASQVGVGATGADPAPLLTCQREGRLLGAPTEACAVLLEPGVYLADYSRWSEGATGDIVLRLERPDSNEWFFRGWCPVKRGVADGTSGCTFIQGGGNITIREDLSIVFEVTETALFRYWIEPPYCTILLRAIIGAPWPAPTTVSPPVSACDSPETVTAGLFELSVSETDHPHARR